MSAVSLSVLKLSLIICMACNSTEGAQVSGDAWQQLQACSTLYHIAARYNSSTPNANVHLASLGHASSWQHLVCPLHKNLVGSGMLRMVVIQKLLIGLQLSLQSRLLIFDGLHSLAGQLQQSLCTTNRDFLVQVSMPEQSTGMICKAAYLLSCQLLLCLLQPSSGGCQGFLQRLQLI